MLKENPNQSISKELKKVEYLKEICCADGELDEQLILDTIEGETNLHELILEIEEVISEYEYNALALKQRIADLSERKARFEKTAQNLRTIILSAMDKAGIQKIDSPQATISVKKKPPVLNILDESLLPVDYWKTKPVLDKKSLLSDLKNGKIVEGAELGGESIALQIRRK